MMKVQKCNQQQDARSEDKTRIWNRKMKKSKKKIGRIRCGKISEFFSSHYNASHRTRHFKVRNNGDSNQNGEQMLPKDPESPARTVGSRASTQSDKTCIKVAEHSYNMREEGSYDEIHSSIEVFLAMDECGKFENSFLHEKPNDRGEGPLWGYNYLKGQNGTSPRLPIDCNLFHSDPVQTKGKQCNEVEELRSKTSQLRKTENSNSTTALRGQCSPSILDSARVVSLEKIISFAEEGIRTLASVDWLGDDHPSDEENEENESKEGQDDHGEEEEDDNPNAKDHRPVPSLRSAQFLNNLSTNKTKRKNFFSRRKSKTKGCTNARTKTITKLAPIGKRRLFSSRKEGKSKDNTAEMTKITTESKPTVTEKDGSSIKDLAVAIICEKHPKDCEKGDVMNTNILDVSGATSLGDIASFTGESVHKLVSADCLGDDHPSDEENEENASKRGQDDHSEEEEDENPNAEDKRHLSISKPAQSLNLLSTNKMKRNNFFYRRKTKAKGCTNTITKTAVGVKKLFPIGKRKLFSSRKQANTAELTKTTPESKPTVTDADDSSTKAFAMVIGEKDPKDSKKGGDVMNTNILDVSGAASLDNIISFAKESIQTLVQTDCLGENHPSDEENESRGVQDDHGEEEEGDKPNAMNHDLIALPVSQEEITANDNTVTIENKM